MFPTLSNHVLLNLQVLIDEVGPVMEVSHDATHMGGSQYNGIGLFFVEETFNGNRVQKVQFLVGMAHQIRESSAFQVIPNSRTHKAVMACYVYFTILVERHLIRRFGI